MTKQFADVIAVDNLSLEIEDGEFFSLLGPSGCGKTTTLRLVAGFEQPNSGQIAIMGQPVAGIPAYRRPVNTVFQSYALFPHMTVAKNIAFGLEMAKVPKEDIDRRVAEALELVQMGRFGLRRPDQLSGGQKQRIALARALVNRPRVLLLDEPLGALDLKLRKAMQLELKHIQSEVGITFIYVTHDQEEAITMSDRIAVMSDGLVQQIGSPREIYEHPTNRFVADFIGETNFLAGEVTELGQFARINAGGLSLWGGAEGRTLATGQPVTVAIRPEKINLYPHGKIDVLQTEIGLAGEELAQFMGGRIPATIVDVRDYLLLEKNNVVLDGHIREAIYIGTDVRYRVELSSGAMLFVRMQNYGRRYDTIFHRGDPVYVHWAAENAQVLTD
ncbi:MAG: ABC transporter ATP-binding protein [Anaerolineales bacterium]|nr:ABC transporter ATP-binding protein [Anaerolineales bacterium]